MNLSLRLLFFLPVFLNADLLRANSTDVKEFADYAFLSQYKSIEVSRVGDGTGKKVKLSILEKVQSAIRQSMKSRGLPVVMPGDTPDPNKTLLVETRLIKFAGGLGSMMGFAEMAGGGKSVEGTGVTIYCRVADKKLETELGTIRISRGGFSKDGNLEKAAEGLVDIMRQKMYDEEGKKPVPVPVQYSGSSRRGSGAMTIPAGSKIAVLSFITKDVSESESAIVSELMKTEIVNLGIGFYDVLDRQYVDKVMSEHSFAASGVSSSEGAAAIGKMLNAQKVIAGSISRLQDTYFLTANMIDVETGKIESAGSGDYKNSDDMKTTIQDIANKIIRLK